MKKYISLLILIVTSLSPLISYADYEDGRPPDAFRVLNLTNPVTPIASPTTTTTSCSIPNSSCSITCGTFYKATCSTSTGVPTCNCVNSFTSLLTNSCSASITGCLVNCTGSQIATCGVLNGTSTCTCH